MTWLAPFAFDLADGGPARPISFGLFQRDIGVDRHRALEMRFADRLSTKGTRSPFLHREAGGRMHVLALQSLIGVRMQSRLRTRNGGDGLAVDAVDPGNGDAIVEADHQFGLHRDMAGNAFDDAHDGAVGPAQRHEVDHFDRHRWRCGNVSPGSGCRRDSAASYAAWRGLVRFDLAVGRDQPAAMSWVRPAAPRNRRRNRSAACTASRSSRCGRPAPRCGNRRSGHSPQSAFDTPAAARSTSQITSPCGLRRPAGMVAIPGAGARQSFFLGRPADQKQRKPAGFQRRIGQRDARLERGLPAPPRPSARVRPAPAGPASSEAVWPSSPKPSNCRSNSGSPARRRLAPYCWRRISS